MRSTRFGEVLQQAELGGHRIERLRVKKGRHEDIRFSWWKDGKFIPQALSMPEEKLLTLICRAIDKGVFTPDFSNALFRELSARHSATGL
jgi:hypothetical protein